MGDYRFEALDSRDFEHLVQALCLRTIGTHVTVFGDGPDGGREATFTDSPTFPTPEAAWSGYGVVQAKFRQRLRDDDGAWALKQLKAETRAFHQRRQQPEYYLFATNVSLGGAEGSGSHDRCTEHLDGLVAEGTLRGFEVWDYAKLSRLVDLHADIRSRYFSWLTPGDVLASMCGELASMGRSLSESAGSVLSLYLQKELKRDKFARLEQAGSSPDAKVLISNVFVDIPFSHESQAAGGEQELNFVREVVEMGDKRHPTLAGRRSTPIPGDTDRPLRSRLVAVGGPGQGKSTATQLLCQAYRASILLSDGPGSHLPEIEAILDDVVDGLTEEGIRVPSSRRFPLRVTLPHFASWLSNDVPDGALTTYLAEQVSTVAGDSISAADIRSWVRSYPCIVVWDGLDEVPASSNRVSVVRAIEEFWIDVSTESSDIVAIVTTRPQGYTNDFDKEYYDHLFLRPLPPARALLYGERLNRSRFPGDAEKQSLLNSRLRVAASDVSAAKLMTTPLQVTIMATLLERIGTPPRQRFDLFSQYYTVIYNRELERDIPASRVLRDHKVEIDAIHRHVGLRLQAAAETSGHTDARMSTHELRELIATRLSDEGYEGEALSSLAAQILSAASNRLVFLVGVEMDRIGFEIRSLQEFSAASALLDGSDSQVRDRLSHIAPLAAWRNAFLFAAGGIFSERQHLRDTIVTICMELNETGDDPILGSCSAGGHLAIDLLLDESVTSPKYQRLLARTALSVLQSHSASDSFRLATVANDVTLPILLEGSSSGSVDADATKNRGAMHLAAALVNLSPDTFRWLMQEKQLTSLAGIGFVDEVLDAGHIVGHLREFCSEIVSREPPALRGSDSPIEDEPADLLFGVKWVDTEEASRLWLRSEADSDTSQRPVAISSGFVGVAVDDVAGRQLEILASASAGPSWAHVAWLAELSLNLATATVDWREVSTELRRCEPQALRLLTQKLPWPLAAAAQVFATRDQVKAENYLATASIADSYSLWLAWESKWSSSGVSLDDVRAVGMGQWLPSKNPDGPGMPYLPFMMRMGADLDVDSIVETFRAIQDPICRSWLSGLLMPKDFKLAAANYGCQFAVEELLQAYDGPLSTWTAISLLNDSVCEDDANHFLGPRDDWMGVRMFGRGNGHFELRRLPPDPSPGTLRVAALIGTDEVLLQAISVAMEGDDRVIEAALRLANGEPAAIETIVSAVLNGSLPIEVAVDIGLWSQRLSPASAESLVVSLLTSQSVEEVRRFIWVAQALVARRRSSLADAGFLASLGLSA